MKFAIVLSLLAGFSLAAKAQVMQWLPTSELKHAACDDQTSCADNLVCYSLAYTPVHDGELTSYTTAFRVDCDGGSTSIVSNASCSMNDNSRQLSACKEVGQVQLLASGNTGDLPVVANKAVYLHQICLQTKTRGADIGMEVDPLIGLTTSINLPEEGAVSEIVAYPKTFFPRNSDVCRQGTPIFDSDLASENSVEVLSLTMYPNPASSHINVQIELPGEEVEISILDLHGRVLASRKGSAQRNEIFNLSSFPAGTYYLSLGEEYPEMVEKFVVVR